MADRAVQATSDIAAIVKALQDVVQEAVTTSNEGIKISQESSQLVEGGMDGLKKILGGVQETAQLVSQISHAAGEQITAGQHVSNAVNTTATQARQVATATAEQTKTAQQLALATRRCAKSPSKLPRP